MSYFIDVQGTLIDDKNKLPIEGAIEFINTLNSKKIPYVVVTNNTKVKSNDFHRFLCELGFSIPRTHYLDPFMTLENVLHVKNIKSFGADEFCDVMKVLGYKENDINPEAIVIASKKDFTAQEYALMIELIVGGAKMIGMHATSVYAKDKRRYPGVGAILAMLSYATGKPSSIVGKPSPLFYEEALKRLNAQGNACSFKEVCMISDDALGDLVGAKDLGMNTILVLSGKCKNALEVSHIKEKIDAIVSHIGAIER